MRGIIRNAGGYYGSIVFRETKCAGGRSRMSAPGCAGRTRAGAKADAFRFHVGVRALVE